MARRGLLIAFRLVEPLVACTLGLLTIGCETTGPTYEPPGQPRQNGPPASAPSTKPRELRVPAEYATIAEAMRTARAGDAIAVAAGEHKVDNVPMKEGVELRGAGRGATVLWCAAGDQALWVADVRKVVLADLRIEARGTSEKDRALVYVTSSSELKAERVDFGGGDSCLVVSDGATVELQSCTLAHSRQSIVYVFGGGRSVFRECRLYDSREYVGAVVGGQQSQLDLFDTIVTGCAKSGAFAFDGAALRADRCYFEANGLHGVSVHDAGTRAELRDVTSTRNKGSGAYAFDGGTLRILSHSILSSNGGAGARVTDGAVLHLEEATIINNEWVGVAAHGADAQLNVRRSIIAHNEQSGAYVYGAAAIRLEETILADNKLHGVSARGADSRAAIEHCVVYRNRELGVWSREGAAAEVTDSAIVANGSRGVSNTSPDRSQVTGSLTLARNLVWDNKRGEFSGGSFPDGHVLVDPKFRDPENYNFALAGDSPARRAAKDGKDIGLYPDGRRRIAAIFPKVQPTRREPSGSRPGRKRALVIGVSQYDDPAIKDLNYADDDVIAVAAFLRKKGYKVTELTNEKATRSAIRNVLADLATKSLPNDQIIFYFSGHGSDEDNPFGDIPGFLLPVDTKEARVSTTALGLSELKSAAGKCAAQRLTVLLDTCFAGGAGSKSVRRPPPGLARDKDSDKRLTGGLVLGRGKVSLYSSRDDEPSYECPKEPSPAGDEACGHGYFTYHLLEAWGSGLIGANDVYLAIFKGVIRDTKGRQHPRPDFDKVEGDAPTY